VLTDSIFNPMGRRFRRLMGILALASAAFCAFAASADDIVAAALENSTTVRTLNINRENTLINRQIADTDPKMTVSLSTGEVTVQKEGTGNPVFSMGPSATLTLPEVNDSTFSFGLSNVTRIYRSGDSSVTFTPDASYRKTIDISSYKDTREDISTLSSRISQDVSYEKSIIQFRIGVLQSIATIMQSEISVKSGRIAYDRLVADRMTALASGEITEGSLADLQSQMRVESSRVAQESAEERLEDLLKTFVTNYGIAYRKPDSVRDADLTLEGLEKGNTSVLLAEMNLEIAQQTLDAATGSTTKLQLGANASAPMTMTNGEDLNTVVNGSVSGTITGTNYSIGARAGASYRSDEFYPYITVSGTWSNKKNSDTDDMTIQSLRNKVILAQIDYDDTLETYRTDLASLRSSVSSHLSEVAQYEVSARYNRLILERKQEMYDNGLITGRDLEDARLAVEKDEVQAMVYALNALVLESRIAALQL